MTDPPTPEPADDDGPPTDGYAKSAWLYRRVLTHVDAEVSGAYTWDDAAYSPIPVVEDGAVGLVFAKT